MKEDELIEYLKNNLKINIIYNGYEYRSDNYAVTLTLKDEEICRTSFSIGHEYGFSC